MVDTNRNCREFRPALRQLVAIRQVLHAAGTLLAADGVHHIDGADVDPVTLAIVRTGVEEEVMLAMFGAVALGLACVLLVAYRLDRKSSWSESGESFSRR